MSHQEIQNWATSKRQMSFTPYHTLEVVSQVMAEGMASLCWTAAQQLLLCQLLR